MTTELQVFDCEQGSAEWYAARMTLPTASMFHAVMAKGKSGGESVTRRKYLLQLAGEILTGEPAETYTNAHMERGKVMEDEARRLYAFVHDDAELQRVGFIKNGNTGCSPDSLVGDDGMLEIKTALPHVLLDLIDRDQFPPEHKAQSQGGLWVAKRQWVDLAIYSPGLPLFEKRAERDENYISQIEAAVSEFNDELQRLVARIRRYGEASATPAASQFIPPEPRNGTADTGPF